MSSDQSWMSRRYDGRGGLSDEYKRGVDNFVEFAQRIKDTDGNILCPCTQCKNSAWRTEDELKVHLYRFGIIESYTRWEYHGEKSNWHDHYSMRTNQDDEDDELEGENERQLTLVEFYEATHEKKGDGRGTFWTKESEDMRDLLVKSWEEYRQSLLAEVAKGEAGNEGESPISPPLSPGKRRRVEAEVVCRATKGPKKNRVFMEGRSTFSEILGPDAASLSQHLKPQKESARLPDMLLQHAIGDAACIVHALDARDNGSNTSVPRSELDQEIQQLAAITLPKDDVHWAEYIHVASSVEAMLDKFGKTINEDTDNENHNLSDDDFRA
ncbi:hypothetical protein POM88_048404 [Heracleum sosnowskyi]|uniref:Transposase-associated domain-containing protein n=1 Tax=Heracleum sosnowskyi TaxID=360622 RepID=A0AAD8GV73_9APIA|nr:hypothetical protein POM88_048404 [Heracleum sosnowskyi]